LPRSTRNSVLTRYPRLDLKRRVSAALKVQATQSPDTRIGFLCRRLRLLALVKSAPFQE
jgi:hypothetical protein